MTTKLKGDGSLFLTEQAAAAADVAGDGQLWVKTATPNIPMFTNDAGNDFPVNTAAMQSNVLALHEGLVCKYVTVTTVDIDATAVQLLTTDGSAYKAESVNLTVDITASGANGLDTGSEATSTWYYLWVIYNGTTVAGLLSTSSTTPTMPSGYTYKGLVGAVYNDSGSAFDDFHQVGGTVASIKVAVVSGGTSTSYTSVGLSASVPTNAKRANLSLYAFDTDTAAVADVASTSSGLGSSRSSMRATGGSNVFIYDAVTLPLVESQTIYYKVSSGDSANVYVAGWEY
jgi:hypothetical protein